MNTFNDFQITARLTADAKITKFQNTSVAHFSVAVTRTENVNGEEKKVVGFMNLEAWRKNEKVSDFDSLRKGQCLFIHGGFKPVEYEKDGVKHHVIIHTASSWESPFD